MSITVNKSALVQESSGRSADGIEEGGVRCGMYVSRNEVRYNNFEKALAKT